MYKEILILPDELFEKLGNNSPGTFTCSDHTDSAFAFDFLMQKIIMIISIFDHFCGGGGHHESGHEFFPRLFSFPEKIIVNNEIRKQDHKILAVVMVKKNPLICEESQGLHTG